MRKARQKRVYLRGRKVPGPGFPIHMNNLHSLALHFLKARITTQRTQTINGPKT